MTTATPSDTELQGANAIDPVWEELYGSGQHINRYPWDVIVSFVLRHAPRDKPRDQTLVVELGCGAGSNLWFAAREGFHVFGVDGSAAAIDYARARFERDGLTGNFSVGNFSNLNLADESADLVIDRVALSHTTRPNALAAIAEAHRVLKHGGKFHFNPFSTDHASYTAGTEGPDGVITNITGGAMRHVGQVSFWNRQQIDSAFAEGWNIIGIAQMTLSDHTGPGHDLQSEWRVIAEKVRR